MKKILLSLAFILMLSITGCGNNATSNVTNEGWSTTDRAGHDVVVPGNIQTIVSLSPALTQSIEDLGLKDKIVATDTQSPLYTEGLSDLPQVDIINPNMEILLNLNPDVVFASEISFGMNDEIFKPLIDAGISVIQFPTPNTIQDIKDDMSFLSQALQVQDKGTQLINNMQSDIDAVKAIASTITDQKTALFEISPSPDIFSFGQGVYLNEMLEIAGVKNILADQTSWVPVTEEAAVAANPDVILTNVNFMPKPVEEILARPAWQNVSAVANHQVFYIDNATTSLPNTRITRGIIEIAKAVYPEQFASFAN